MFQTKNISFFKDSYGKEHFIEKYEDSFDHKVLKKFKKKIYEV